MGQEEVVGAGMCIVAGVLGMSIVAGNLDMPEESNMVEISGRKLDLGHRP